VSSVLGGHSRIRLVLEADYIPRTSRPASQLQPQAAAPERSGSRAEGHAGPTEIPVRGLAGVPSGGGASEVRDDPATTGDDQVPDEISRWAAERGGLATIVKDSSPRSAPGGDPRE
jgi:hypothetical protein